MPVIIKFMNRKVSKSPTPPPHWAGVESRVGGVKVKEGSVNVAGICERGKEWGMF